MKNSQLTVCIVENWQLIHTSTCQEVLSHHAKVAKVVFFFFDVQKFAAGYLWWRISLFTSLSNLIGVTTCRYTCFVWKWGYCATSYHVLQVVFIQGTLSCSAHAIKSQNPSSQQIPLFSGAEGGEGERVPGTHCLHVRLIAMELCGDHVHMCMYVCIVVMS